MKNLVYIFLLVVIVSACSTDKSEQKKMFEIANRQMEFNDYEVQLIDGLVETDTTMSEVKLAIAKNCYEFHKNILAFQTKIKDQNIDQKGLRIEINEYLDRFLQEVNPELSHESYLDGAISRGLLSIELAYIEKSFLDDQKHKANK